MKTAEELNALNAEVETLNKKLSDLIEDELKDVSGGVETYSPCSKCNRKSCEGCSNIIKDK